jgi:sialidase-1
MSPRGDLLAFCQGRKSSRSDSADWDMLVKRSADGGRTWSRPQTVWDDGPNTCYNACAVVDEETGAIWLLMTWKHGGDHERSIIAGTSKDVRRVFLTQSTDAGLTWTRPKQIAQTTTKPHWRCVATGPGVGIQLRHGTHKGRLVIPCHHRLKRDTVRSHSHIIYSDDHGKTWKPGGATLAGSNECQLIERTDGTLLLNMRRADSIARPCRLIATSRDSGVTWSESSVDKKLIDPGCQASILRYTARPKHTRNRILFSNPASARGLVRLTVRLSYDESETWPVAKILYASSAAYSCLAVLPDMTIGCLYERDDYEKITFARFTLEWLTDGADKVGKAGEVVQPKPKKPRPGRWIRLFNGNDLTGWDGNPDFWSVKNGAIHGETTREKPARGNTFCIWRGGALEDFELRLAFRIRKGNSGVQYRSKDLGNWRVSGYQAEVCTGPTVGVLYHERGRGFLAKVGQKVVIDEDGKKNVVGSVGDPKKIYARYKKGAWNHYRILARGKHLAHFLNGVQTIELIDNDVKGRAMSGILALQIHAGPPMAVEFKDIEVRTLDKDSTPPRSDTRPRVGEWQSLFNGEDLSGWTGKPGGWAVERGTLAWRRGCGFLWTEEQFGDFILELEFKLSKGANSGVFFRTTDRRRAVQSGLEIQLLDSHGKRVEGKHDCGAIYGRVAPSRKAVKPPGSWNHVALACKGSRVLVMMNGKKIIDTELKDLPRVGHIGLQDWRSPVWFRNIRIKRLASRPRR